MFGTDVEAQVSFTLKRRLHHETLAMASGPPFSTGSTNFPWVFTSS
jgi:hypothetical protein